MFGVDVDGETAKGDGEEDENDAYGEDEAEGDENEA